MGQLFCCVSKVGRRLSGDAGPRPVCPAHCSYGEDVVRSGFRLGISGRTGSREVQRRLPRSHRGSVPSIRRRSVSAAGSSRGARTRPSSFRKPRALVFRCDDGRMEGKDPELRVHGIPIVHPRARLNDEGANRKSRERWVARSECEESWCQIRSRTLNTNFQFYFCFCASCNSGRSKSTDTPSVPPVNPSI